MCQINDAQDWFESTAETFAKPDWESSTRSITNRLKELVERHKDNSPPELIDMINAAVERVHKFELRIYYRCRIKKSNEPIHPDPFWIYNGYEDALESLVLSMNLPRWMHYKDNNKYRDMLWPYELHYELLLMLELWKYFSQGVKDARGIEEARNRAGAFAAETEALQKEVETWESLPVPKKTI
ncbi:hypothetical protein RSOLAG1IB_08362 [Rhizoctonia solani AG-1 IB]|uniref:Uncharacterized protein n=1 Tax=Thanatephorus cucumeris (strain AG1-IB / isolate 7/3/14) TaxID=1108050 RepID=M5BQM7_THACB|nr:hypothetical protein BN14_02743 [Rhizoctonia solani AG-1 IB]CEL57130.1 hypothetical protein RSOLAG1IB_08362 [Rhizoctonia solani AG-1 IB]